MSSTVPSPKSIPRQTSVRADELSSSDFWHGKKGWKSRENKTGGGAKNHSEDLIGSFWDGDAQKALYGILFRRFLFRNTSFSSEILKSMIIIELVCSWNLKSTVIGITKPPPSAISWRGLRDPDYRSLLGRVVKKNVSVNYSLHY